MECPNCSHKIETDGNRLPPWCPKCGSDFKRPRPETPPAGIKAAGETAEPAPPVVQPAAEPAPPVVHAVNSYASPKPPVVRPTNPYASPAPPAAPAEPAFYCPKCSNKIIPDGNRLPPWCSRCGSDIKRPQPRPAPAPPLPPPSVESPRAVTAQPPVNPAPSPPSPPPPVEPPAPTPFEPMRFQLDWKEPRAFRSQIGSDWIGVGEWIKAGLAAALFIGVLVFGFMWAVVNRDLGPEALKLYGSLTLMVGAIVAFLVLKAVAVRAFAEKVEIGPNGISWMQSGVGANILLSRGRLLPSRKRRGRNIPWDDIREVVYMERFPLGGNLWRVLIVHTVTGQREPIAIADGVPRERLAKTIAAWGKQLEDAPASKR